MYKVILLSLALIQTQWLHAQTSVQNALTNTPHPALEAPASAYKAWAERPDYLSEQGVTRYAWSLRDRKWAEIPQPLFGVTGGLIKGPRALRPESVQEYQLACVSLYQGTVKHLWRYEPGQSQPIKVGSIHSNDEVEIEWEMRVSPGIRVISRPTLPATVRYLEPIATTFKIELNSQRCTAH